MIKRNITCKSYDLQVLILLKSILSGYSDSNGGPPAPKAGALANCATPRFIRTIPLSKGCAKIWSKIQFTNFFYKSAILIFRSLPIPFQALLYRDLPRIFSVFFYILLYNPESYLITYCSGVITL